MIEATTVFRRCPDIRYRIMGDEGVVVRQAAGEVLVLNEIGVRILDLISATPVGQLIEILAAQYDVEKTVLEKDVAAYLQELSEAGVIERADSPATP